MESISGFFVKIAKISALIGIFFIFFFYGPRVLSWISSNFRLSDAEVENLNSNSLNSGEVYTPTFNPRLPKENRLTIPSIGVKTELREATYDNYESALRKGVWRVSDFSAPGSANTPTILAAHRFGYLNWTNKYRRENSFFNLPKLKVGDTVEIIWHQRKYMYEVYAESKGTEITDYSANLILYTCESLVGEERIFRYARLLKV